MPSLYFFLTPLPRHNFPTHNLYPNDCAWLHIPTFFYTKSVHHALFRVKQKCWPSWGRYKVMPFAVLGCRVWEGEHSVFFLHFAICQNVLRLFQPCHQYIEGNLLHNLMASSINQYLESVWMNVLGFVFGGGTVRIKETICYTCSCSFCIVRSFPRMALSCTIRLCSSSMLSTSSLPMRYCSFISWSLSSPVIYTALKGTLRRETAVFHNRARGINHRLLCCVK